MDDATAQLVTQARTGHREAVGSLIEKYLPELHAFVRLRIGDALGSHETTEDLVQSACRETLEKLDAFEYRSEREFKRWLFLQAQRKIVSRARFLTQERRDVRRVNQSLSDAQLASGYRSLLTPSRVAAGREAIVGLERAFEQLTAEQREVLTAAKILGMNNAEIAAQVGKSVGAVRVLLHRAMVRLAFLVADDDDDDDTQAG